MERRGHVQIACDLTSENILMSPESQPLSDSHFSWDRWLPFYITVVKLYEVVKWIWNKNFVRRTLFSSDGSWRHDFPSTGGFLYMYIYLCTSDKLSWKNINSLISTSFEFIVYMCVFFFFWVQTQNFNKSSNL